MTHFDALFVINQNCDFVQIAQICSENSFNNPYFLSTHYLFENERKRLFELILGDIEIHTFAEFLTDGEMEECDTLTTQSLKEKISDETVKENYNVLFMDLSVKNKNIKVWQKLKQQGSFGKIYFYEGLGINKTLWEGLAGINITKTEKNAAAKPVKTSILSKIKQKIKAFLKKFFEKKELIIVEYENKRFIFFTPINRIKFSINAKITKKHFKGENIPNDLISADKQTFIGTTIHQYDYNFLKTIKDMPVMVFIDGYHPSNYPATYVDSYFIGEFTVRDMFDCEWFTKYGKKAHKPSNITVNSFKKLPEENYPPIKNIIFPINHAGDWTALINRSDTDILIEAFCALALKFPDINFIVRPHPTMVHETHEGANSINRIKEYVSFLDQKNLTISESSLDEDFSRGDLFISEYSQVLIDVFNIGKLGLIANLTNRRSFMKDYEDLGFFNVNSIADFKNIIEDIIANPSKFAQLQASAARKYNEKLQRFINL